jgi:hypothetical protein
MSDYYTQLESEGQMFKNSGLLRRFWIEGWVENGNKTDEVAMMVEALDGRHALSVGLDFYGTMNNVERGLLRWSPHYLPPEVIDLGEVPQDVLMRRQGQPELPLAVGNG